MVYSPIVLSMASKIILASVAENVSCYASSEPPKCGTRGFILCRKVKLLSTIFFFKDNNYYVQKYYTVMVDIGRGHGGK